MRRSINNELKRRADLLFASHKSSERQKINSSIRHLKSKLGSHFGNRVTRIEPFGSYTRGTILPRKYDENSDIDMGDFDGGLFDFYEEESFLEYKF